MVLYVGKASDDIVMLALSDLLALGAQVRPLMEGAEESLRTLDPQTARTVVALFSSEGDFPNRYFRFIHDEERNKNRKIIVPEWAQLCGTKIAINARRLPELRKNTLRLCFRSGVTNIHAKVAGYEIPRKRRVKSGGGYHRRRQSYMPL